MAAPKTKESTPGISEVSSRWPMLVVITLLAAGVAFIYNPTQLRFFLALESHRKLILAQPDARDYLPHVTDFRTMDRQLPKDTRIFFSGVVGPNNRLFPYYFARTFLYPREVEISLDHKADFQIEGFRGVDCASLDQLRTNGYDLMLIVEKDHRITGIPLTEKGVLKP
jgi:hypothetical protein